MTKFIFTSPKWASILTAVALGIMLCSFSGDKNVARFQDAVMSLDKTTHTLIDEYDYWPECGIRVTGSHLASLISLTDLQGMLPCPLYVSGPHSEDHWDLDNKNDFGHYNPKAIQYLAGLAKKVVADERFVKWSQSHVDTYLHRQMHIMMVLHDAIYDEDLITKEGRENIFNQLLDGQGYDSPDADFFCNSLALEDGTFVYGNTSNQFLYFWARRWKDGTIDQFYQALSTVFKAYYPSYVFDMNDYWIFDEEESEYEETYVVIDGSELRLRLEPSTSADTFKWGDGTNRHPKVGERYLYLGEEGDFYQIDFHGHALWVSKKYTHLE